MADNQHTVTVIVLSFNSRDYLEDCFNSLMRLDYPAADLELLLVDNASSDGSANLVSECFPMVKVLRNSTNLGFDAGNNVGARQAQGMWLAFLNPDMRVTPDWLHCMLAASQTTPDTVCVASRVLSWDGRRVDFGGARLNFYGYGMQVGYGDHHINAYDEDADILFPCGGAVLIRRDVFLEIGGFDEDFFSFFEDVDLGWRLWMLGYRVRYAGRAVVYHWHHGAWGKTPRARRQVLYERNALYTIFKNYADASLQRVWPASVMALVLRAFLTMDLDPTLYRVSPLLPSAMSNFPAKPATLAHKTVHYYWKTAVEVVREMGISALARQIYQELLYRWRQWKSPRRRRRLTPRPSAAADALTVPDVTLSYFAAAAQFHAHSQIMLAKRTVLQCARQREDAEIFPLFETPFLSNYGDDIYIRILHDIVHLWDLKALFGTED